MSGMPEPPTKGIADAVLAHVRSGAESDAPLWEAHYDPGFVSVEADGMTHRGIEEITKKHEQWFGMMTVHSFSAEQAYCGADRFAIAYEMDVEPKDGSWPRMQMKEIGVYTVENGKVVREEFLSGGM